MLEPQKPSRATRRRRLSRRQPPQPPIPIRPAEDRHEGSRSKGTEMTLWQPNRLELSPNQDRVQSRGMRRDLREPSRQESARFNLRHLLSNDAARPPQRSRGATSGGRSRSEARQNSQISFQPVRRAQPARGLEPVRQITPLNRRPPNDSRSKLVTMRRPGEAAPSKATGQVKSLKTYPIAPAQPQGGRRTQRRSRRPPSPLLYLTRLLILGIGVGAIAGTILSVWDPAMRESAIGSQSPSPALLASQTGGAPANQAFSRDLAPGSTTPPAVALKLNQPMMPLAATVESLTAQYPGLTPGVFLVELDSGNYLDLQSKSIFSAASMIKVPVLVAFLQDVDAGKIRLDEMLTMQQADLADGSGDMQYQEVGTQFSALETAFKMITISDNTATNMLINRLGGADALNQRFRGWGLTNTVIRNKLPDLTGTNTTTPRELGDLLAMVSQGDLLSLRSRDRMMDIMQNTVTNTLLPSTLDEGAVIAHKTGNIDTVVGDTGIVDMPNGRRYIVTIIVQRPTDDERAQELIRQISRAAYVYLSNPAASSQLPATPLSPESQPATNTPLPTQNQSPAITPLPTGNAPSDNTSVPTSTPSTVDNFPVSVPSTGNLQ